MIKYENSFVKLCGKKEQTDKKHFNYTLWGISQT